MTQPGDAVYLGSVLVNMHCYGLVSDLATPSMMSATMECLGADGAITMDALVGPPGVPGEPSPIVKMQYGSSIDDPGDLPDNLTNTNADIGTAYWIGNQVYMWDGEQWVPKAMGTQGPPGPVPLITPSIQLLDPDDPNLVSEVITSGTAARPGWLMKLKAPRGPRGYNATIRDATDYSEVTTGPPDVGDVIAWNGNNYVPAEVGSIMPRMYSVPESNFTSFSGFATRQQIASFVVPPSEVPCIPWVTGHIRAVGMEADSDPLILGCEVRLGDPTSGVLIARGFGNSSTWTTIVPHFSSPQATNDAVTPDNGRAVIPTGSTGSESTIFLNLFNDGVAGAYIFQKQNAQLAVLMVPVGTSIPLGT